ncbi:MAG: tRNA (guanosine(37)-N1)-methyltransferase TrmD [Patescibacteria group bacterium]|nr:tRNA (guanosine(37)-N1)-methyltransferase TrmD [Patescibacteria group bacterium]
MLKFKVITIFPNMITDYANEAILKRAQEAKKIAVAAYDLRDWTDDNHRSVDDKPFGGGAGMVMKIEPLYKALKKVAGKNSHKILLSAKGKTWNQTLAKDYATKYKEIVLVCGRYEGVDERINEFIDEEISIGDYVLTGGELGALVIMDSVTRLIPGVLGNATSLEFESHNQPGLLESPQYTRPEVFKIGQKRLAVPEVLLSGNHKLINDWRQKNEKQMIKKKQ